QIMALSLPVTMAWDQAPINVNVLSSPPVTVNTSGLALEATQLTGNSTLVSILSALGIPFQVGGSIGNTSFASTQGTSPWVVSGTIACSNCATGSLSGAIGQGSAGSSLWPVTLAAPVAR